ncbi:MAG: DNA polymerase III subunit delta, partial [Chloroflexi bacterium]|nr:DNA polymerase III subunit delta [Chloroflexota bacterium]
MIRVLHGDDDFGIGEVVRDIRASLGQDAAESNTLEFEGRNFRPGEVEAAARTVPFLADRRLVIVRGLLRRLDTPAAGRRSGGSDVAPMSTSGWDAFGERLAGLPDSTELVFVEAFPPGPGGKLLRDNGPAFRALQPAGAVDVSVFATPRGRAIQDWIRNRAMSEGVQMSPSAIARLADLVGPNLRLLDQEIRKLALYADGRTVQPDDVELMVAAREANIFAAVDAILERRPGLAMRALYQLMDDGASVQYIISMLSRQTRMLILA